jgi:hypothetical protein
MVKYNRVFRTLAFAIILSLLVLAMIATPALAQSITLSPASGTAGTTVTVTGAGFTAYATVYILFDYIFIVSASVTGGTFNTSFIVPSSYTTAVTVQITVQKDTPDYNPDKEIAGAYFTVTARQIVISPLSGYVGSTFTVSGTGFNASSIVTIYFDIASVGTATTNASGAFSGATFTVPESYRGTHAVKGTAAGGDSPGVSFTTLQKITVTPASGGVGDTVTINGTGFAASSGVTIYFDDVSVGNATTNANGSFTNSTFVIPPSSRGSHTIKAQDAGGNYATIPFTVAHKITITPNSGVSGTTVTVKGTGFSANMPITIKYKAVAVTTTPATITSDANGSFTASFTVPAGLAGTYPVEVSDGTYSASANFTATINVNLSPVTSAASPGYVGMEMTITGTGFMPNFQITITYTSEPVTFTTTSDEKGAFSYTFKVPKSEHGAHTITASDGTNTLKATFIVESTAPPISKPLLPYMGDKAKSKADFDWEDVDDVSKPVTYDLQIASDADFKTMLVDKTGLTTSKYTLTDAEKLKSTSKEAPYYWRIRAVDAASNASGWSGAGTFYVGFIFPEIKGWVLYALIGVGALLLFFLGLWAGRRGRRSEYY